MITLKQSTYSVYDLIPQKQEKGQLFSERRNLLANWCASIEKAVLSQPIKQPIFAGFQQLSFFLPVIERYQRLAPNAKEIWIFGQPDKDMPKIDNIHYVHLNEGDALLKEWFLIVNEQYYSRALIAKETTTLGTPHKDRTFEGIILNQNTLIKEAHDSLSELVKS